MSENNDITAVCTDLVKYITDKIKNQNIELIDLASAAEISLPILKSCLLLEYPDVNIYFKILDAVDTFDNYEDNIKKLVNVK